MLGKLLSPITSPDVIGVNVRYFLIALGPVLVAFGVLTQEQFDAVQAYLVNPEVIAAIAGIITLFVWLYGVFTKSSTAKADAAAKAIDAEVPANAPVKIETPPGNPDIIISGDGRKVSP